MAKRCGENINASDEERKTFDGAHDSMQVGFLAQWIILLNTSENSKRVFTRKRRLASGERRFFSAHGDVTALPPES